MFVKVNKCENSKNKNGFTFPNEQVGEWNPLMTDFSDEKVTVLGKLRQFEISRLFLSHH